VVLGLNSNHQEKGVVMTTSHICWKMGPGQCTSGDPIYYTGAVLPSGEGVVLLRNGFGEISPRSEDYSLVLSALDRDTSLSTMAERLEHIGFLREGDLEVLKPAWEFCPVEIRRCTCGCTCNAGIYPRKPERGEQ